MGKSIRYLTDKGFQSLIKNIEEKYPFLTRSESSNHVFTYLNYYDIKVLFFDNKEKRVTISELGILFTKKNGVEYVQPKGGNLEDILTRKTLIKRLNDIQELITKYYGV